MLTRDASYTAANYSSCPSDLPSWHLLGCTQIVGSCLGTGFPAFFCVFVRLQAPLRAVFCFWLLADCPLSLYPRFTRFPRFSRCLYPFFPGGLDAIPTQGSSRILLENTAWAAYPTVRRRSSTPVPTPPLSPEQEALSLAGGLYSVGYNRFLFCYFSLPGCRVFPSPVIKVCAVTMVQRQKVRFDQHLHFSLRA